MDALRNFIMMNFTKKMLLYLQLLFLSNSVELHRHYTGSARNNKTKTDSVSCVFKLCYLKTYKCLSICDKFHWPAAIVTLCRLTLV